MSDTLCISTTGNMAPCRMVAAFTVAGRAFCQKHAYESAGIMAQPVIPVTQTAVSDDPR